MWENYVRTISNRSGLMCCKQTYVSEAIPLRTALRVQRVYIIVGDVRSEGFDTVLESFTVKCRFLRHSERKAVPIDQYTGSLPAGTVCFAYSNRTISPVMISAVDALTRFGVKRFNLPSYFCALEFCDRSNEQATGFKPDHLLPKPTQLHRVHREARASLSRWDTDHN